MSKTINKNFDKNLRNIFIAIGAMVVIAAIVFLLNNGFSKSIGIASETNSPLNGIAAGITPKSTDITENPDVSKSVKQEKTAKQDDTTPAPNATKEVKSEDGLVIAKKDLSQTAKFYSVDIDGTKMEVIAVEASDGSIRTAFNTCQVCFDSGRGYYELDGTNLVCQNCGNTFGPDEVSLQKGGCNPVPIFAGDRKETSTSITISKTFLNQAKDIFENWKS